MHGVRTQKTRNLEALAKPPKGFFTEISDLRLSRGRQGHSNKAATPPKPNVDELDVCIQSSHSPASGDYTGTTFSFHMGIRYDELQCLKKFAVARFLASARQYLSARNKESSPVVTVPTTILNCLSTSRGSAGSAFFHILEALKTVQLCLVSSVECTIDVYHNCLIGHHAETEDEAFLVSLAFNSCLCSLRANIGRNFDGISGNNPVGLM